MVLIANFDVESNFTPYKVSLYEGGIAEIWVVKTRNDQKYLQAIKRDSSTYKRVLRQVRQLAQLGSLSAEQIAEFDR